MSRHLKKLKNDVVKILLTTCICSTFLLACNNKPDCNNNFFVKNFFSGEFDSEAPPSKADFYVFMKLDNNKVVSTRNYVLFKIYNKVYQKKFLNFSEFVCSLFSTGFQLNSNDFSVVSLENTKIFDLNSQISNEYDTYGIDGLIKNFFLNSSKKNLEIKRGLTQEQVFSILYYMYLNEYYITYSDDMGNFSFSRQ